MGNMQLRFALPQPRVPVRILFDQKAVGLMLLQLNGQAPPKILYAETRILSSPDYTVLLDEPMAWSPDSKSIAFFEASDNPEWLVGINIDGGGKRKIRPFGFDEVAGISWGR